MRMTDNIIESMANSFLEKKTLLLTVTVNANEDAEQLIKWLYAPEKPMSAELHEIAWDKVAVSKVEAEALTQFKKALMIE